MSQNISGESGSNGFPQKRTIQAKLDSQVMIHVREVSRMSETPTELITK